MDIHKKRKKKRMVFIKIYGDGKTDERWESTSNNKVKWLPAELHTVSTTVHIETMVELRYILETRKMRCSKGNETYKQLRASDLREAIVRS